MEQKSLRIIGFDELLLLVVVIVGSLQFYSCTCCVVMALPSVLWPLLVGRQEGHLAC